MEALKRRRWLLAAAALACSRGVSAQVRTAKHRVGFLYTGSRQSALDTGRYGAFLTGMRELGYVEGRDFVLDSRFADGDLAQIRALAKALVEARAEVVITSGTIGARTLRDVSNTVPVVVAVGFDPVREGLAASLARPGGNITGLSALLEDVFTKHVEMLKEAIPGLARLAVLMTPSFTEHPPIYRRIREAAAKLNLQVVEVSASSAAEIEPALVAAARERAQAMIILGNALYVQRFREIGSLAIQHHLGTIYSGRELPEAGGLMSYGPDFRDNYRRAASFVDRIFRGARPGDLPFEQPTRLELVLNLRTAKALGLAIPRKLVLQADSLIE